ncbi:hypothetical protein QGM71_10180 [Virgibacillus sp. C22-A2]|uniref:Uncharacterized protein n=1 Tax=Virgibacillus tibetensis TaxID=3042313 RepID=A0ABU6KHA8_9BACI|nr:hypothetical protein [Virgibacillus sp. C22-A2]
MENLWLILLVAGLAVFIISFLLAIYKALRKTKVITPSTVSLLIISLILVCGSLLITIINNNLDHEKFVTSNDEEQVLHEEVMKNESIDSSQPISDRYEPIEIAEILVEQEMAKRQIDPDDWEITEIEISSDNIIDNIADYDKPVGKMRVVWVTGYVSGIGDVGNIDLELYKLDGDTVWYIDKHWGVLRDIEVPEMPSVDESNYQLSTSDQISIGDNDLDESEVNSQEIDDDETSEYFAGLEERYLSSLYEHFEQIGLINYLEGGKFYIKDTEVFQTPAAISDRREYTYYLDGTLTTDFGALTENEQYELLTKINFGEFEFYEGHMFDVDSIELISGTDVLTRTTNSLDKNGERFLP